MAEILGEWKSYGPNVYIHSHMSRDSPATATLPVAMRVPNRRQGPEGRRDGAEIHDLQNHFPTTLRYKFLNRPQRVVPNVPLKVRKEHTHSEIKRKDGQDLSRRIWSGQVFHSRWSSLPLAYTPWCETR